MEELKELSIDNWITILTSEIIWNRERLYHETTFSAALASLIIAFTYLAITTKDNLLRYIAIFVIIIYFLFVFLFTMGAESAIKRRDILSSIREYAIHNPQNLKEIREKWQVYKEKKYYWLF